MLTLGQCFSPKQAGRVLHHVKQTVAVLKFQPSLLAYCVTFDVIFK